MSEYKAVMNPHTGTLTLIRPDSAFSVKESVATYTALPTTGNFENDVRITRDTDLMYTWSISSASGILTDWKLIGSATSVDWSAITNGPTSSPTDIDDAVAKRHTQGTDQKLDDGGANEVVVADVKDAVDKKHSQNTDTGTDSESFTIDNDSDHDGVSLENENSLIYGTDICNGGVSSASGRLNSTYSWTKAFDNSTATRWISNPGDSGWIAYEFAGGASYVAQKYTVVANRLGPYTWQFEGWNGVGWDILHSVSNYTLTGGLAVNEFYFSNATAYTKYRWNIISAGGIGDIQLVELEIMELASGIDGIDFKEGDGSGEFVEIRTKGILTDYIKETDGTNSASVENIRDAVDKKHSQNTDEDIIITSEPSADVTASGIKSNFVAGENLAFGDVCYVNSDGKLWKGDANAVATASVVAMALGTILADASGSFLLIGIARNDAWAWTVGALLYLSGTTGELTETAPSVSGDQIQILGVATHADRIYFKPELVQSQVV